MHSKGEVDAGLHDLHELLGQWKTLTLAEFEKIQGSDWQSLEEIQKKKAELQPRIENLENAFSESTALPEDAKAAERKTLKQIASDLLTLEKRNEAILSDRIAEADRQIKSSSKTIQSLRHVQKAYGGGKSNFWQAYS